MLIRPYQPEDLQTIQTIAVEAFGEVSIDCKMQEQFGIVNKIDWKVRKAQSILDDVNREPTGVFVSVKSAEILGFITTWHNAEYGIGYIPNLAVSSQHRSMGLGRKLIEHALDYFRAIGLKIAKIETLANNEAGNHLYRDLGFKEVAQQVHFFKSLDE